MSTLLERMVLRTRAPLSSLEPLAASRYAPVAQAGPPRWDEQASDPLAANIPEASADVGTPADPGQAVSRGARRQRRASPLDRDVAATPGAGDDFVGGNADPPVTRRPSAATLSAQPPLAAHPGPAGEEAESPPRPPVPTQPRQAGTSSAQPPTTTQPNPDDTKHQAPAALALPERQAAEAVQSTGREPDFTEAVAIETGPTPGPAGGQPVAVAARLAPATPPSAPTRLPGSRVPVPPGDAEPARPDVTISIGHIEVRTATAPVQRPRPAFQPEVSLADFLGKR